jgi:tetratricopeptide (TPR) repeat protein
MAESELLSGDDVAAIAHASRLGSDPQAVVADLVAAVDEGRIADVADHSYALGLAAEVAEQTGDLERAISLAERAAAAHELHGDGTADSSSALLAELLIKSGRDDEGMAILTGLRPLMATDPLAGSLVAETLETLGRVEVAVEWLTEALASAIALEAGLDDEDPELVRGTEVVYELATCRHRLRGDLDLDHDEYDELADELQRTLEAMDEPGLKVFWPQPDFEALTARWPALAAEWEPSWDEHRRLLERDLRLWSEAGHTDLLLLQASAGGLSEFSAQLGLTAVDSDVEEAYLEHLLDSPDAREVLWPPPRNAPCWCGSGAKYKKCCLPRGRP